jgi:hypothetical protein
LWEARYSAAWKARWASRAARPLPASRGSSDAARLLDPRHVGGLPALGRQPDGERVQLLADLEQAARLGGGQRGHPGVPVRVEDDQALGGQPAHGLAQRGGADLELGREGLLAHGRTLRERAGHDPLADLGVGVVGLGQRGTDRYGHPAPSRRNGGETVPPCCCL